MVTGEQQHCSSSSSSSSSTSSSSSSFFVFSRLFFCRFYESCWLAVLSVCGIRKGDLSEVCEAGRHTHLGSRHQVVVHLVSCVVSSFPAFGERVNFTTKGRVSARARRCCEAGQKAQLARHSGTQADRNESQHYRKYYIATPQVTSQ